MDWGTIRINSKTFLGHINYFRNPKTKITITSTNLFLTLILNSICDLNIEDRDISHLYISNNILELQSRVTSLDKLFYIFLGGINYIPTLLRTYTSMLYYFNICRYIIIIIKCQCYNFDTWFIFFGIIFLMWLFHYHHECPVHNLYMWSRFAGIIFLMWLFGMIEHPLHLHMYNGINSISTFFMNAWFVLLQLGNNAF